LFKSHSTPLSARPLLFICSFAIIEIQLTAFLNGLILPRITENYGTYLEGILKSKYCRNMKCQVLKLLCILNSTAIS
jgi:hypothetical protein